MAKNEYIQIRVTQADKQQIAESAKRYGDDMDMSKYLLMLARRDANLEHKEVLAYKIMDLIDTYIEVMGACQEKSDKNLL